MPWSNSGITDSVGGIPSGSYGSSIDMGYVVVELVFVSWSVWSCFSVRWERGKMRLATTVRVTDFVFRQTSHRFVRPPELVAFPVHDKCSCAQ